MSILEIIQSINDTPSRNAKESILTKHKDNTVLRDVFKAALDSTVTYGIKKLPTYTASGSMQLVDAMAALDDFAQRTITGNAAIDRLTTILSSLSADDATIIERIIGRDLRCGVSTSTVNKIWANLVAETEVMLCHKDTSGIVYPAFAQLKGDGMRCHLYFDGETCTAISRNGKQIYLGTHFDAEAKRIMKPGETWDGELLVYRFGKAIARKTGNGILNKAIKQTITRSEIEEVRFMFWDIVDSSSSIQYKDRLAECQNRVKQQTEPLTLFIECPTEIVHNEEEAKAFYRKMRRLGFEGAVIKNFNLIWEGKRVKGAGKMKAEEEADLVVVGIEEGEGKNAGRLGKFIMETSDGIVRVGVGVLRGDDSQRDEYFTQDVIGQIATVLYNEKIQDERTGKWSLFLPVFVEFRLDKDTANTFEELK